MQEYQLVLGDCLCELQVVPDGSVGLVLLDLPWGRTRHAHDVALPLDALWVQIERVLGSNGVVLAFAQFPYTMLLWQSRPDWCRRMLVWNKRRPTNHLSSAWMELKLHNDLLVFSAGKKPKYEPILRATGKRAKYRGNPSGAYESAAGSAYECDGWQYPVSIYEEAVAQDERPLHPHRKPVALLRRLIGQYSLAGELVLDPTMGSGAAGEAALLEGRRFVGIEKDPRWFGVAEQRITAAAGTASPWRTAQTV